MKYKEEDIKENIEALFLLTLFYFPLKGRYDIAKIIRKALKVEDEDLIICVEIECFYKEVKLLENGTISKRYYDDDKHKAYDSYLSINAEDVQAILNETPKNDAFAQMQKDLAAYTQTYYKEKRIAFQDYNNKRT